MIKLKMKNCNIEAVNISALSSDKVDQYEYITSE